MSSYLALDLATETGAAFWRPGMALPRAWKLDLPEGAETGIWLDELFLWTEEFVRFERITDISVETPLIGFGGEEKNFKLIGAAGVARMIAARTTRERKTENEQGCTAHLIANQTFYSHWVGSNDFHGKERKARSVVAAHLRGFGKVTNHNIADALGVLTYRLHMLGIKDVPWNIQKGMADTLFQKKGTPAPTKADKAASTRLLNSALSFDREKGAA